MKLITKTALILVAFLATCAGVSATDTTRVKLRERYISSLPSLTNARDSLTALYNILDLSLFDDRAAASEQLLDFALRHGNDEVTLDMVRNLANSYYKDAEAMNRLTEIAESAADSPDKKETLAFLNIFREIRLNRSDTEQERQNHIVDLIRQFNSKMVMDPYDQVVQLFTLCMNLSGDTNGELLDQYFGILAKKLDQLDLHSNALRNMLLVQQGICYTNNGSHERAVEVDRQLLNMLQEQEEEYKAKGRPYRNYPTYRYTYLNRQLRNYPALTDREVEQNYREIISLASQWPAIHREITDNNNPLLFVLLKQKRYAEAIPMLKKRLADNHRVNIYERRILLQHLVHAAKATGDEATLNEAAEQYASVMDEYVEIKTREALRELQIVYDLNHSNEQAANLRLNHEREVNRTQQIIILSVGAISLILLVAIVFTVIMAIRARRLSAKLKATNVQLRSERDKLAALRDELIAARDKARSAEGRKTEFINYISHEIMTPLNAIVEYSQMIVDAADESKREYMQRFADVVRNHSSVLHTFAIDLQEASLLENNLMSVRLKPTDLTALCSKVINSMGHMLHDGAEITYAKSGAGEYFINTDSHRVALVMLNLLTSAAKRTDSDGIMELDYQPDADGSHVTISFTATQMEIPADLRESIFERFTKLTSDMEGFGMSLYIGRMVATLLGGTLEFDSAYTGLGTRFLFTIPTNR